LRAAEIGKEEGQEKFEVKSAGEIGRREEAGDIRKKGGLERLERRDEQVGWEVGRVWGDWEGRRANEIGMGGGLVRL
jgi:hypothetical protein